MNARTDNKKRITCDAAVAALKVLGRSVRAKEIAEALGTTSRAVATALRGACEEGRVSIVYKKTGIATYRFKRMKKGPTP